MYFYATPITTPTFANLIGKMAIKASVVDKFDQILVLALLQPWSGCALVSRLCLVLFDQILVLPLLQPWSGCALVARLVCCII